MSGFSENAKRLLDTVARVGREPVVALLERYGAKNLPQVELSRVNEFMAELALLQAPTRQTGMLPVLGAGFGVHDKCKHCGGAMERQQYPDPNGYAVARYKFVCPKCAATPVEPFVVRHYAGDERPSIKGNGFDGLEIGETRQDAQEFVDWVNTRIM